jgi:formylmethanofuran dehydrogenase subunit D
MHCCLQAIDQAPEDAQERAVYFCNAAACYLKKQDWQLACEQCTAALKINGSYLKVCIKQSASSKCMNSHHAAGPLARVPTQIR